MRLFDLSIDNGERRYQKLPKRSHEPYSAAFDDLPSVTFSARVLVTNIPPGVGPERAEAALPSQTKALTGD